MSFAFVGEIRAFSFPFAPTGWALCNGQTLSIAQNQPLFALLGTTYGGDGQTTFQLPNLQGNVMIGQGSTFPLGTALGEATHTLTTAEMPVHSHAINAQVNGVTGATNTPGTTVILGSATSSETGNAAISVYGNGTPGVTINPLGSAGGNQPHENRMPFLVMSYCIALNGIFPSRD
ncbi:phage tail protein [Acidiphilium angustum]|uniref:phage tail protein n=1 Tax=Acidiphilium angustum TaxID=523 RepID=UPI000494475E|nr:tail fiber protein [Acidiphilium angustum]